MYIVQSHVRAIFFAVLYGAVHYLLNNPVTSVTGGIVPSCPPRERGRGKGKRERRQSSEEYTGRRVMERQTSGKYLYLQC